jgi:hypothetical protein
MNVAEAGEDRPGTRMAQRPNQFASEEAKRDGIEQKDAFTREPDDAPFRGELEQLAKVEVGGAHVGLQSI